MQHTAAPAVEEQVMVQSVRNVQSTAPMFNQPPPAVNNNYHHQQHERNNGYATTPPVVVQESQRNGHVVANDYSTMESECVLI